MGKVNVVIGHAKKTGIVLNESLRVLEWSVGFLTYEALFWTSCAIDSNKILRNDFGLKYFMCSSCEKVNVLNHKGFLAKAISKKSADYEMFVKRF